MKNVISDKKVFEMIRQEKGASEILKECNIKTLETLQRKVLECQQKDEKWYNIKGILLEMKPISFGGLGVLIQKRKLSDTMFNYKDTFDMKIQKDVIILTKTKK